MKNSKVKAVSIVRIKEGVSEETPDILAVEEPLEIRIAWLDNGTWKDKNLAVTMRTPGNDLELVLGFLFTEGIISSYADVDQIWHCERVEKEAEKGNVVKVKLSKTATFEFEKLNRNFYTTSSCGVCGKSSIESINQTCSPIQPKNIKVRTDVITQLVSVIESEQAVFKHTGGIHASALFNLNGDLLELREDVGRHNALDKIIGTELFKNNTPLTESILLVSGRASFELVQKAVMAGIPIICAVGAPSSLAYDLAKSNNLTLVGFLKPNKFNIYCGEERVQAST